MSKQPLKPKPIYFSDHFKVDKAKMKELGVFDPILNFDTKLFVDPILLKSSSSEIIQKSRKRYVDYFNGILKLLKNAQQESDVDRFWRAAKQRSKFSEYKYTCIGYGDDSIDGAGPGPSFSDKLLESAKDIIEAAKDDSEMFLLLPLLEDGMGADGISDMTQSIIDDDICTYTETILKVVGITGTVTHRSREGNEYLLPKNPFSKAVIKLLPQDILADLPLADTFDGWLVDAAEINPVLRQKVNDDIGASWFEQTKKDKKESLLRALKEDDDLFVEVLKVLKESAFEPYDVELDHRGVHRWLKDSEKFVAELTPNFGQLKDSLNAINELVQGIVSSFKDLVENKSMKGLFWADVRGAHKHVNEFYSQMLFFMVSKMWLAGQNSNVDVSCGKLVETDQFNIRFTISGAHVVLVQVKHANNTSLQPAFQKHVEHVQNEQGLNSIVLVLNFKDEDTLQFAEIKRVRYEGCELVEIHTQQNQDKVVAPFSDTDVELTDFELDVDFKDTFVELENMDWSFDENYHAEKRRAAKASHKNTDLIREHIIKPLSLNSVFGKNPYRKSINIDDTLIKVMESSEEVQHAFVDEHKIDYKYIKHAIKLHNEEKFPKRTTIEKWCRDFKLS